MKTCIFCGNKPESKTKEHVIPKWLIEMTGDPNRITLLGKYRDTLRKYPWKNFTFPACDKCNGEYAKLESRVKIVIQKLLEKLSLSEMEINDLLDWLDKVRIGIWLGHIQLDKQDDLKPNFHIKQRLGVSDRMASISYIKDNRLGIGYTGTEFPAFRTSPSCFTLFINNVAIFNLSKEFAFTRRLGFPFPKKILFVPNESRVQIDDFDSGTERIMFPIIRKNILSNSVRIYQAIFKVAGKYSPPEIETEYFSKYFIDGKAKIFIENDFTGEIGFMEGNLNIGKSVDLNRTFLMNKLAIQTLEFQNYCLTELCPCYELLDDDERKKRNQFYRENIKFNIHYINKLKKNVS
ncbi:MAG: hypothetical protein JNL24_14385 [Bacteroidia bacterium]|nr:hypothetical protein [Bacteroidia bacterium]